MASPYGVLIGSTMLVVGLVLIFGPLVGLLIIPPPVTQTLIGGATSIIGLFLTWWV